MGPKHFQNKARREWWSIHISAVAFRAPRIAFSIDLTRRHSHAGSSILLGRKLHASLRNIRPNCVEKGAVESARKGCERANGDALA